MGNAFGKKKPLKEVLKENKRMINKAVREIDREKRSLEANEKKLVAEIKKMAKQNQMNAVKILAKDLVRTRQYITKFITLRSHLTGVQLKIQTVKSHEALGRAMGSAAAALTAVNKQVNLPELNKIMQDFARENEIQELTAEQLGDTLDDVLAEDGDEEEEDKIVSQVLDEIGIDLEGTLADAPVGVAAAPQAAEPSESRQAVAATPAGPPAPKNDDDDQGGGGGGQTDPALSELEARLNNLKRN
mmetsp:Transcript_12717/g.16707  ORF Transcript_12717/g.16707 Transcript_12717/m.16707 type:complete len:245 (-) Transcript_12717:238-972(-)